MISNGADKTLLGPQIANHFAFLEGELAKRDWFAGADFTAADIQMSFPLEAAAARARRPSASSRSSRPSSTASRPGRPTSARSKRAAPTP